MAPDEKQERRKGNLGRVLVTGGNGNLGFEIINQLLSSWTTTAVASIDLRCNHHVNPQASYFECDITDPDKMLHVFNEFKPEVVIHTASPDGNSHTATNSLYHKVNVEGTKVVVDVCQKTGVKALVYTSSASVCSNQVDDLYNADERWPVLRGSQHILYYSETKAAAEELVLNANRQEPYKLLTCSLRPAAIFGEDDTAITRGMMIVLKDGKQKWQIGDNTNIWDFTYVGNVAHAHMLAARLLLVTANSSTAPLDHEKVDGEAFFITNDSPCYFWDIARAFWRAAGYDKGLEGIRHLGKGLGVFLGSLSAWAAVITRKEPAFTPLRARMSCVTRYYNINKAKTLLGYEPLWTLQEGIDRSVKWYLDNPKE